MISLRIDFVLLIHLQAIIVAASSDAPTTIVTKSQRVEVSEHETVLLPCAVENLGDNSVVWRRGRRVLTAKHLVIDSDSRLSVLQDHSLNITRVLPRDSGNYTCTVSTRPVSHVQHVLHVLYEPRVSAVPTSGVVTAVEGENATLQCVATGNPAPTVFWKKQHGSLPNSVKRYYDSRMIIYKISRKMAGVYLCLAENGIGSVKSDHVTLHVHYAPVVRADSSPVFSGEGQSAKLECHVTANPSASVSWVRYNASSDLANIRWKMTSSDNGASHQLIINDLIASDFAKYSCRVNNYLGQSSANIQLTGVPKQPRITSGSNAVSTHKYFLTWTVQSFSPVLEFRVGYRTARVNVSEVDKPLKWKEVKVPARGSATNTSHLYRQQIPLSKLQPNSAYHVYVLSKNHHGWSAKSIVHKFTTVAPALESRRPPASVSPSLATHTCVSLVLSLATFAFSVK